MGAVVRSYEFWEALFSPLYMGNLRSLSTNVVSKGHDLTLISVRDRNSGGFDCGDHELRLLMDLISGLRTPWFRLIAVFFASISSALLGLWSLVLLGEPMDNGLLTLRIQEWEFRSRASR